MSREENPQFNFSSPNLNLEHDFFKCDGKVSQDKTPNFFHIIWKHKIAENGKSQHCCDV